jgi:hypothetical protein
LYEIETIRLSYKGFEETNTLAYFVHASKKLCKIETRKVKMMSRKMVMLSETLTAVKMKSKSMVLGCGMNPETKEVKWVDPAAVTALAATL